MIWMQERWFQTPDASWLCGKPQSRPRRLPSTPPGAVPLGSRRPSAHGGGASCALLCSPPENALRGRLTSLEACQCQQTAHFNGSRW